MIYIPQQIGSSLKLQTVARNIESGAGLCVFFLHMYIWYMSGSSAVCACLCVVSEGRAAQEALTSSSITEPHPAHSKDVRRT